MAISKFDPEIHTPCPEPFCVDGVALDECSCATCDGRGYLLKPYAERKSTFDKRRGRNGNRPPKGRRKKRNNNNDEIHG